MISQLRYLLEGMGLLHLSWRDRAVAVYFSLSLMAVFIVAEAPIWVLIAVVLNFCNAARMVRTIDLPELTDGDNPDKTTGKETEE